MHISEFARIVTKKEGKKVELSIAQILEVLHIIDDLTNGILYSLIRLLPIENKHRD